MKNSDMKKNAQEPGPYPGGLYIIKGTVTQYHELK